jgi:hypothetical protein
VLVADGTIDGVLDGERPRLGDGNAKTALGEVALRVGVGVLTVIVGVGDGAATNGVVLTDGLMAWGTAGLFLLQLVMAIINNRTETNLKQIKF